MEHFPTLLQAYLEVGVLGLIAITFVLIVILLVKKLLNSSSKKEELTNNQYTQLLNMVTEQNKQLTDTLINNNKTALKNAINEITNHTPSKEDNEKQTKINNSISICLQDILLQTGADRVAVIQYHNGGRGINKQSFQKLSMTNEQVQIGVRPVISQYTDQFRNIISYIVKELDEKGKCFIKTLEEIKEEDTSTYEFLLSGCTKSLYSYAIKNNEGVVIGFILVNYEKKENKDTDKVEKVLKQHYNTVEALLNL